jgi:hypothetical protein
MYVYVWKDQNGIPFYVGMGLTMRRAKPTNKAHRNRACLDKLAEIGPDSVIVELHTVADEVSAKQLEQTFIAKYGRLCDQTGTLTNIRKGGEFHFCTPETAAKIKTKWQTTEYRTKIIGSRLGKKRNLAPSTVHRLQERLAANPKMKGWSAFNGQDPEFDAKRIAGIRAAQGKRREKMSDPAALAQRKARLKATLSSPEYAAKRAAYDTPEYRAKLSAAKKAYWEKRRAEKAK